MQNVDSPHELYNNLPSLREADNLFSDRKILSNLQKIFVGYEEFGITLIHRHTTLAPGEIMVGRGDTAEPKLHPANVFPSSWLATGEVFEYRAEPTPPLPDELLKRFKDAVKEAGILRFAGKRILGICYVQGGLKRGEILMESTHGRKNIVRHVVDWDSRQKVSIETCWLPDSSSHDAYAVFACCIGVERPHNDTH